MEEEAREKEKEARSYRLVLEGPDPDCVESLPQAAVDAAKAGSTVYGKEITLEMSRDNSGIRDPALLARGIVDHALLARDFASVNELVRHLNAAKQYPELNIRIACRDVPPELMAAYIDGVPTLDTTLLTILDYECKSARQDYRWDPRRKFSVHAVEFKLWRTHGADYKPSSCPFVVNTLEAIRSGTIQVRGSSLGFRYTDFTDELYGWVTPVIRQLKIENLQLTHESTGIRGSRSSDFLFLAEVLDQNCVRSLRLERWGCPDLGLFTWGWNRLATNPTLRMLIIHRCDKSFLDQLTDMFSRDDTQIEVLHASSEYSDFYENILGALETNTHVTELQLNCLDEVFSYKAGYAALPECLRSNRTLEKIQFVDVPELALTLEPSESLEDTNVSILYNIANAVVERGGIQVLRVPFFLGATDSPGCNDETGIDGVAEDIARRLAKVKTVLDFGPLYGCMGVAERCKPDIHSSDPIMTVLKRHRRARILHAALVVQKVNFNVTHPHKLSLHSVIMAHILPLLDYYVAPPAHAAKTASLQNRKRQRELELEEKKE